MFSIDEMTDSLRKLCKRTGPDVINGSIISQTAQALSPNFKNLNEHIFTKGFHVDEKQTAQLGPLRNLVLRGTSCCTSRLQSIQVFLPLNGPVFSPIF